MLRKLLSIILSITLSIIFCFSSTFAKSDKLNSSNWFVDIKYGEAISKTSKIDDQELFYLQSRGISKSIAEKLIVLGFFEEIIGRAGNSEIIESLRNEVSNYFTS